jgi:dienelactone hydrolase
VRGTPWTLPAPSGPDAVGTTSVMLPRAPGEPPGTFAVQMWYPANPAADRAPYGPGAGGIRSFVAQHLVRTHSARNAPVADTATRIPLLIYCAGWSGARTENTALAEDLASHGFAVVALDDIAREIPAIDTLSGPLDLSSDAAFHVTLALAGRKRDYAARRVSYVLDRILASDGPLNPDLRARLDTRRIAVYGYSFGGAIAMAAARHDSRFRAAMNMDGWAFPERDAARHELQVPYLYIGTDEPPPTAAEIASSDPVHRNTAILDARDGEYQRTVLGRGGASVLIAGTQHLSFVDDLRAAIMHRPYGPIASSRLARVVGEVSVAFFRYAFDGPTDVPLRVKMRDPAVSFMAWPMATRTDAGSKDSALSEF